MDSSYISYYAENLDMGETMRVECPECSSMDRTLSITLNNEGTTLYQCFRASCEVKGSLNGVTRITTRATESPSKRSVWDGDTLPLPTKTKQWLAAKWGLEDVDDWYYTTDYGGRVVMSIRSPKGLHRGWVLRNDGSSQPKALTYLDEGTEIALSWYLQQPGQPTIIVEDIPSAIRASAHVNAVSLLGTGCGDDKANEIAKYATKPILIALDQDALDQSFTLLRKYSLLWKGPRVLPLQKDIKDMKEDEVCALLTTLEN